MTSESGHELPGRSPAAKLPIQSSQVQAPNNNPGREYEPDNPPAPPAITPPSQQVAPAAIEHAPDLPAHARPNLPPPSGPPLPPEQPMAQDISHDLTQQEQSRTQQGQSQSRNEAAATSIPQTLPVHQDQPGIAVTGAAQPYSQPVQQPLQQPYPQQQPYVTMPASLPQPNIGPQGQIAIPQGLPAQVMPGSSYPQPPHMMATPGYYQHQICQPAPVAPTPGHQQQQSQLYNAANSPFYAPPNYIQPYYMPPGYALQYGPPHPMQPVTPQHQPMLAQPAIIPQAPAGAPQHVDYSQEQTAAADTSAPAPRREDSDQSAPLHASRDPFRQAARHADRNEEGRPSFDRFTVNRRGTHTGDPRGRRRGGAGTSSSSSSRYARQLHHRYSSPSPDPKSSPSPATSTDKEPPAMPDLGKCVSFDGTESVSRWLSQLHWQFRRLGFKESDIPASEMILSINMLCKKEAAEFLDSDAKLRTVVARATHGTATNSDLISLEQSLKDKYPSFPVDYDADRVDMTQIKQDTSESLSQYYARVLATLRKAGGRDDPADSRQDDSLAETSVLAPSEVSLLRTAISRFVDGLCDTRLRHEALGHRARSAKSLWQCYESVKDSQRVLEDKQKVASEEATLRELESLRRLRDRPRLASYIPTSNAPNAQLPASSPAVAQPPPAGTPLHMRLPDITCYICNQPGHYATYCPQNPSSIPTR